MKKYIFAAASLMMLSAGSAFAQDDRQPDSEGAANYLYFDSGYYGKDWVVITPEENQGVLKIYLDNETEDLNSMLMDLYLPEGFTIAKNKSNRYMVTYNSGNDNKTYNHTATVKENNGFYRIAGLSVSGDVILTGDDLLMTIVIQAPDDYTQDSPTYTAELKNIQFASRSNETSLHYFPDMTFLIMSQQTMSGIEDVMVGAEGVYPEGVYDLNGRRLNPDGNLAPGFYIIDGVKTHIK